ncbi:MAG: LysM peptidoglycan-binding domain-containing protein [Chloroflexi bacterium]|nr:LysM peptidoglycan-binding domain-containing protein [Chloroflexota bacterium]OJV89600.1 MAG: hypothetical protein BGO39_37220 [Chloroflexi bacterium 54-19]
MSTDFSNIQTANKATIKILWKNKAQETLTCHFNPEKYTITRTIGWQPQAIKGGDTPATEFTGGGPSTTQLTLLFDTSLESTATDVRSITKKLWDAARIETGGSDPIKTPPNVMFSWGTNWAYEAVITSLSEEFIYFNRDGLPLRSNVTIGLQQIKDDDSFGRQNPTSGAIEGDIYIVREGDRLDLIAARAYKKPGMWRSIAEFNGIDSPGSLRPGQRLIIPPAKR